jgi:integrase
VSPEGVTRLRQGYAAAGRCHELHRVRGSGGLDARQQKGSSTSCGRRKRSNRWFDPGVTLHSYRYAWAERARKAGYPERFAQEALGHNSKAVHRSYARRAQVTLPTLEEYERKIIPLQQPTVPSVVSSPSSAIA